MILVVLNEVAVAMARPSARRSDQREGQRRKMTEAASVWQCVNSPYSFHLSITLFIVIRA